MPGWFGALISKFKWAKFCVGGGEGGEGDGIARILCALLGHFWQCPKTDENKWFEESAPRCRFDRRGVKAIWAMPI